MHLIQIIKSSLCFQLLPFWYPLISTSDLQKKNIHYREFDGKPLVIYKSKNNYIIHSDICPHQGASLSKGFLNENENIQCPYHGFEFEKGNFKSIPNENKNRLQQKIKLKTFENSVKQDFLFIKESLNSSLAIPDIFYPPEEYDSNFIGVDGSIMIDKNYQTICENLLDMLHISYVHSFGNKNLPLPKDIHTKRLNPFSFRSTFTYTPNLNTISNRIGRVKDVIVENEYHLPTNTITRVIAGNIIKTVFTRSIPISKTKTLLYWKIYRNFWIDPHVNSFTLIGNYLLKLLMQMTIQEDIGILNNVYENHRNGSLIVKYDVTIQNFRRDLKLYQVD